MSCPGRLSRAFSLDSTVFFKDDSVNVIAWNASTWTASTVRQSHLRRLAWLGCVASSSSSPSSSISESSEPSLCCGHTHRQGRRSNFACRTLAIVLEKNLPKHDGGLEEQSLEQLQAALGRQQKGKRRPSRKFRSSQLSHFVLDESATCCAACRCVDLAARRCFSCQDDPLTRAQESQSLNACISKQCARAKGPF